jgi:hypothetical protein
VGEGLLTRCNEFTKAGNERCPRPNHGQWEDHAGDNTAVDSEEIRELGMGVQITGTNLYTISSPGAFVSVGETYKVLLKIGTKVSVSVVVHSTHWCLSASDLYVSN